MVFINVIHIRVGVGHEFDRYQSRNAIARVCTLTGPMEGTSQMSPGWGLSTRASNKGSRRFHNLREVREGP